MWPIRGLQPSRPCETHLVNPSWQRGVDKSSTPRSDGEELDMSTMVGSVSKRRYNQIVKEGRKLVAEQTRIQWEIGDLALEIEPMGDHGGAHSADAAFSVTAAIAMFAEDIGLAAKTVETYRWVSSRWEPEERFDGVPHRVHRAFTNRDDRIKLMTHPPLNKRTGERRWDTDSALRKVGQRVSTPVTTQEKIQRIHDLARDDEVAAVATTDLLRRPNVAFRAMTDPTAKHMVNTAQVDQARQAGETARRRTPAIARQQHTIEFLDLVGGCAEFVANMGRIVPDLRGHQFSDDERQTVRKNLARVRTTTDWIESAIDSDTITIDEALADLLGGEQ